MNRDDILRMAREAGLTSVIDAHHKEYGSGAFDLSLYEEVTRFSAFVAAAEREACAKVCEDIEEAYQRQESIRYPALRTDAETGSGECAAAIRARGIK
jgi:hypothetical protein